MNGLLCFLLGFSLFLNIFAIIAIIVIYKKIIKNNPLSALSKVKNIDKEFWEL